MSGKPCTATAVIDVSDTACAEMIPSAMTRSSTTAAEAHASRGSTSGSRGGGDRGDGGGGDRPRRQARPHGRAPAGSGLGAHAAPEGLHAVADVGEAGTRRRRGGVEA